MTNENPDMFKQQFDILSNGTKEYNTTVPFIINEIQPQLPQSNHFVDIGAGRGNLAKPLSQYFERTTFIEPNPVYYKEILDWAKTQDVNITGINSTWQEAELSQSADCILMSHMLYYVPKSDWKSFIKKAYNLLNAGGYIVIILNRSQNGVGKLYEHFLSEAIRRDIASAELVIETLKAASYSPTILNFGSHFRTNTAEEMYELIDLLLLGHAQFNTPEIQEKRASYTTSNLKHGGQYSINSDYSIITIQKPLE